MLVDLSLAHKVALQDSKNRSDTYVQPSTASRMPCLDYPPVMQVLNSQTYLSEIKLNCLLIHSFEFSLNGKIIPLPDSNLLQSRGNFNTRNRTLV